MSDNNCQATFLISYKLKLYNMGFDDFFEKDHNQYKHGHSDHYRHDNYSQQFRSHDNHNDMKYQFLSRIQNNPKLKGLLIGVIIIILIVIVGFLLLLFPLIMKLINFITENGIQGIIDAVWKGTK